MLGGSTLQGSAALLLRHVLSLYMLGGSTLQGSAALLLRHVLSLLILGGSTLQRFFPVFRLAFSSLR